MRFGLGVCGGKTNPIYPDMRLYEEVILLKHHFKGKWVVENVMAYYEPLIKPQKIGRHWYWSNFNIVNIEVKPSRISQQSKEYSKSPTRIYKASDFEELYGYDLSKYKEVDKRLLLRNCVEPKTALHIFKCAFKEKQQELTLSERSTK